MAAAAAAGAAATCAPRGGGLGVAPRPGGGRRGATASGAAPLEVRSSLAAPAKPPPTKSSPREQVGAVTAELWRVGRRAGAQTSSPVAVVEEGGSRTTGP